MSKQHTLIVCILAVALTVAFSEGLAWAHTPSPPICNDPFCNIDINDTFFQPAAITIRPPNPVTGENVTVVWQNHGIATHTVTSGTRGSPDGIFYQVLGSGATFQLVVDQNLYDRLIARYPSGTVPYYCSIHLGMDAMLTISGDPIPEFSLPTFLLTLVLVSSALLVVLLARKRK